MQYQHTRQWSDIEKNWRSMVSEIEYEFDVKSQITKSFILSTGGD